MKTKLNNKILIGLIIFFIFIIMHFYYFKTDLGHNPKFVTLTNIYIGLCTIVTIYSIFLTNKISYSNAINNEISNINPLFHKIIEDSNQYFISNTNMKYYYNELFNDIPNQDETIRDNILEEIISTNILINIDAIISYIYSYKISDGSNFELNIMEQKLFKLLNQFMKSNIFIENWNKFKDKFALDWTKKFIKINYGK